MVLDESASIEGDESKGTDTWSMSLYDQLTSSDGRINQLRFLILILSVGFLLGLISILLSISSSLSVEISGALVALPTLYIWYSLVVKRLQDTGRGGQWKQYAQISVVLSIISNPASLILISRLIEGIGLENSTIVDIILL